MKKGDETRDRLIRAAGRLLQTQGFFATGINEILAESQTPRGSFYFHFLGGKEELAVVALEANALEWKRRVAAAAPASDLPEALSAVCAELARVLVQSDFQLGCPLATTTLEVAATELFRSWCDLLAAQLEAAGIPAPQRAPMATLILSAIEGALLLARAYRDPEPLYQVAVTLKGLLRVKSRLYRS